MSYNYIGTPNPNLICCICRAPFTNPYTTGTCSHTFCQACILTALEITSQCPIDRSALRTDNLSPADPILRNLVDELLVECPNRPAGCTESCQRQLVEAHLRETCLYSEVPCAENRCDKQFLRRDVKSHTHGQEDHVLCGDCGLKVKSSDSEFHKQECTKQTVTCPACLSDIPTATLFTHTDTCPDTVIPCTHAINGCPWTGRRNTLTSTHIPICPYESIKGFFVINDAKMSVLSQENAQLRHQIHVFQGMVSIMQRELDSVKRVLDPWYRPTDTISADPSALPSDVPHHTEHPRDLSPTVESITDSMARLSTLSTDLSFASFFPPAEEDITQFVSPSDLASSQGHSRVSSSAFPTLRSPHYHHHRPPIANTFSQSATSQPPPPHMNPPAPSSSTASASVAPLNISTSLYGSLSSLHTSVVSLASALDSMGRHQDVALTTEAMRMGEEVRSLRAVVSGLRMQVHAIMVDRNSQVTGRPVEGSNNNMNQPVFPGVPGVGEAGPWPAHAYFGLPLPRFPPYPSATPSSAPPAPVTKL